MNTAEVGRLGEKLAAKFLKKNRYKIVDMNVHKSHNEIDIIAKNKEFIVFVEVKTRSFENSTELELGMPASAVTHDKQKRTIQAARSFLKSNNYRGLQPRFDVIEVYLCKTTGKPLHINHIINAFQA